MRKAEGLCAGGQVGGARGGWAAAEGVAAAAVGRAPQRRRIHQVGAVVGHP
jgi:hypothetical protein